MMPDDDITALIKEHRVLLEYAIKEVIAQLQAQETQGERRAANGANPVYLPETLTSGIAINSAFVKQNLYPK
ncbi:hypothetical protein [Sodalis sp. dw_96]|uniref:hypothetical protein n=1 Tax=Sodalis sp. dw_96 TaxID=2719794 RepID=UPI001BD62C31|nr:hypothetical protein [Sodalis sp. dw_96]